jgi:formylmethanofuran dehydrogenase subunit C
MPLVFHWLASTTLPVESEVLRPDAIVGRSPSEVSAMPARVGREVVTLGDLFRVEGDGADGHLVIEGDVAHVRGIGAGMASGTVTIRGDAGPRLGAGMSGGTIELFGSASSWVGVEMTGGLIRIRGSAGDFLGSAYPGSRKGMRNGMILVDESIGRDAGLAMRRGVIAVGGSSGDGLARGMIAGSVLAFGEVGRLPGAGMKRGTLALFDPGPGFEPSPTFAGAGAYRFPFMAVFLKDLRDRGFPVPTDLEARRFERYNGDLLEGGRGEMLILAAG